MKAFLVETWGVKLGWACFVMGGWIVLHSSTKKIEWWPHYVNVRAILEGDEQRIYN